MPLILSLIFLATVWLTGYVILSAILGPRRRHWTEIIGLSFAAGAGAWGLLLFVISIAGVVPTRLALLGIVMISIIGLALLIRHRQYLIPNLPEPMPRRFNAHTIFGAIAVITILITAANVAAESFTPGLADIDAFAIWMLKAKIVFTQALRPIPAAFLDPALSFSHQDYPLGFPMLVAGVYAAAGKLDVQLGKLVLLPIYLSLICVLYSAIRQRLNRPDALILTAIFAAAPILREHAGMAVAEVLLVLMHTGSLVLFLDWMETRNRRSLILAAVFAAFAAFTKNEGLALLPILLVAGLFVAAARRSKTQLVDLVVAVITAPILMLPWLIYRHFLPFTHENYGGKLTDPGTLTRRLSRLGEVLSPYLSRLFEFNSAGGGGIWLVLIVGAAVGWRAFRSLPVLVLWFVLIAHLALYAATFMVTPWSLDVLIPMVASKLIMHAASLAALLAGLHISEFRAKTAVAPN